MMLATVRSVSHKCLALWTTLHVERHGSYSVERLCRLMVYSDTTTSTRAFAVLATTPLLCVATTVLLDCLPLQPPSAGLGRSHRALDSDAATSFGCAHLP